MLKHNLRALEMIKVSVANQQTSLSVDEPRLRRAIEVVFGGESIGRARVSLAVVDDAVIRRLNRQYLDEDDATDVLSFPLGRKGGKLEGEVVVSAETAAACAPDYGWPAADELLLYVIHGALHLAGYDDESPEEQAEMRRCERKYLAAFGVEPRYDSSSEE